MTPTLRQLQCARSDDDELVALISARLRRSPFQREARMSLRHIDGMSPDERRLLCAGEREAVKTPLPIPSAPKDFHEEAIERWEG